VLSAVKGPTGAYFRPPAQLDREIIQSAKESLGLLAMTDLTILDGPMGTQGVTVRSRSGNVFKGSKIDLSDTSARMALTMAQRNLNSWPFTAVVVADNLWLQSNLIADPEAWLKGQLNEVLEEKQDYYLLYGNGVEEPLGILSADDDGIPSTKVITEGATTGKITFKTLLKAYYSVRPMHRTMGKWFFGTDALVQIEGLLDGSDRPIIRDMILPAAGGPTRSILGVPVVEHEQIDTGTVTDGDFAAATKLGFIGNLKKVKSVMSRIGGFQVSTEALFEDYETVIKALFYFDALPADADAFAVVATAAS
jgi:HK97 family phage major capsid protein